MVEKHVISPTYAKDNGLWLLNTDSLEFPENFNLQERNVVFIPSGEFGGNHKHPRTEAFIGVGDGLQLIWQDDHGLNHSEQMGNETGLQLFVVRSLTPHVVVNRGAGPAVLLEFADGPQRGVTPVDLLGG